MDVIKIVVPVFVGGALGATLREFLMLMVPQGSRGFPLDILVANLVAALLLGFVAALHSRKITSDGGYALIGTGITGGLSTFSSFAYGSAVLMTHSTTSAVVALAYVLISLVTGYIAVIVGLKLGKKRSDPKNS
jgi:CrcB protein